MHLVFKVYKIKPEKRDMFVVIGAKLAFMRERSIESSLGRAPEGVVAGGLN
jgi:hypothetical protein